MSEDEELSRLLQSIDEVDYEALMRSIVEFDYDALIKSIDEAEAALLKKFETPPATPETPE